MRVSNIFCFVISEMGFEIRRRLEFFLTDRTLEIFQVSMNKHMAVDKIALSVIFSAQFAPKRHVVKEIRFWCLTHVSKGSNVLENIYLIIYLKSSILLNNALLGRWILIFVSKSVFENVFDDSGSKNAGLAICNILFCTLVNDVLIWKGIVTTWNIIIG